MVDIRKLLPLLEENADKLPDVFKGLVKKAPAIEGEVVGDLASQVGKKVLPDIETTATQKVAPLMIERAAQEAPEVAEQAAQTLGRTAPKQSFMDALTDLSPQKKALAGAGILTAASAPLLMNKNEEPKDPRDTTNFVSPEYSENEGLDEQEPEEADQHAVQYPEGKSTSEYLALSKKSPYSINQPEVEKVDQSERKPSSQENSIDSAREEDRQRNLLMGMLKAGQMAGSALAGGLKADTSYADKMLESPNQAFNQLKSSTDLKEEMAAIHQKDIKRDPKSAISVASRDLLKKMGATNIDENMSAEDIEKVFPQFTSYFNHLDAIEARKEIAKENALNRAALAKQKKDDKEDQTTTTRLEKLNKDMVEEVASGRSAFGTAAKNLQAISNAKALLAGQDPDSIDNRQIAEVARVLDRTLSGGTPTISGTAHLTPETARMQIAHLLEKYTNTVQGAGAGDFMRKYEHTLDREEQQSKKQIQATQGKFLASVADIARTHPEKLNAILEAHGLKGTFNERGVFVPDGLEGKVPEKTTVSGDKTTSKGNITSSTLLQYAKKHNINVDEAASMLTKAGYNVQR